MPEPIHRRMGARDWGRLLFLSLLWGGSFFFIAVAVRQVPPIAIVASRVAIGAAALWLVIALRGVPVPSGRPVWLAFAGMAVLNNIVPFTLFAWAQQHIPSGVASVLNATTPLFATLAAHVLTADEKVTPMRAAGVACGFVGVAVMLGLGGLSAGGAALAAEIACLAASLLYALSSIYGRRFAALGIPPMVTAAGQLTVSTVLLVPATLLIEQPWTLPAPGLDAVLCILALGLASTGLAYVVFFRILGSAGATNLTLVTFLIPVTANVLGVMVLGERLEPRHLAGMALVGLGLAAIDGRPWGALTRALRR